MIGICVVAGALSRSACQQLVNGGPASRPYRGGCCGRRPGHSRRGGHRVQAPEHQRGHVRWTARDDGDGLGYDILSFDLDGHERYIEVKTTALGAETPFYITSAELDFAQRHADRYALYRVYNVLREPRFFALEGNIAHLLGLTPHLQRAHRRHHANQHLAERSADRTSADRIVVQAER